MEIIVEIEAVFELKHVKLLKDVMASALQVYSNSVIYVKIESAQNVLNILIVIVQNVLLQQPDRKTIPLDVSVAMKMVDQA